MRSMYSRPVWLAAALETEADIAASPIRALAIDQAAHRRSTSPDVVRRQLKCLEYVRRHTAVDRVQAGMSVVELLIGLERTDPRGAGSIRQRALQGGLSVAELRQQRARMRLGDARDQRIWPNLAETLDRIRRDLPQIVRLETVAGSAGSFDPSWVGANFAAMEPKGSVLPPWAWLGIVSPRIESGCLRGAPTYELVRCVLAASLWADVVSIAFTYDTEAEVVREACARAHGVDRAKIVLHDLREPAGSWTLSQL